MLVEQSEYDNLTPEEKRHQLYLIQKDTLDKFLERKAISEYQYEQSLRELQTKMGLQ